MLHHNIILRRTPFFALDSLLENFSGQENAGWMRSDIEETEEAYQISIDLPGVKKEQVEVSLEESLLSIAVAQEEEKEGKFIHAERRQGYGKRSFTVPKGIEEEDIQAQLADGVLQIRLEKKEAELRKHLIALQ